MSKAVELFQDAVFIGLLHRCQEQGMTRAEFSKQNLPEGISEEEAWCAINNIRRATGRELPFVAQSSQYADLHTHWYFPSNKLLYFAESCFVNGFNNPHVTSTLHLPEGRHIKYSLLGKECLACTRASGWSIPYERLNDIILGIAQPFSAVEQLAYNYYQIMLSNHTTTIEKCTPEEIEDLFSRAVEGADLPENTFGSQAKERRFGLLQKACEFGFASANFSEDRFAQTYPPLMRALIILEMFKTLEPFPVANVFIGRMLCSNILRSHGMTLVSYVPIIEFYFNWKQGTPTHGSQGPQHAFEQSVVASEGNSDWTIYFEEALRYIAERTIWLSNKLNGVASRRNRLLKLFEADVHHNTRQRDLLIEALVHADAEFTYESHMTNTDIVYSTAYTDLFELGREGFLEARKQGKKTYFVATPDIRAKIHALLRTISPELYDYFYDDNSHLRKELIAHHQEGSIYCKPLMTNDNDAMNHWPKFEPERGLAGLTDPSVE